MSRAKSRFKLGGAAALVLLAAWGPALKPAAAQTPTPDPPAPGTPEDKTPICVYDERTGGFIAPDGLACRRARGYSWGSHFGYVSARSIVLREVDGVKVPIWAIYEADRLIDDPSRLDSDNKPLKVFLPGVPEEIGPATGSFEQAKVMAKDEVAFVASSFAQLKKVFSKPETEPAPRELYDIVSRTEYESTSKKFLDKNGDEIKPKPALGSPNTTHVVVLKPQYVQPQAGFIIGEFPMDPREAEKALAGEVPQVPTKPPVEAERLNQFLVATRSNDIGKVLMAGEGVITYLAGFGLAMTDKEAKEAFVRKGICDESAAREVTIDGKVYTAWDDLAQFERCDAWRLKSIWGGILGVRVDSGSRWGMDAFEPVLTQYYQFTDKEGKPQDYVGRFDLSYPYAHGTQFWDTLFVSMAFAPFDPRVPFGSRFITRRKVQGGATLEVNPGFVSALASSYVGRGLGNGLNGSMGANYSSFSLNSGGAIIDTQKPRSVNVAIELAYMTGDVRMANVPRYVPMPGRGYIRIDDSQSQMPEDATDANAAYFDGLTSYGHIHDKQPNRTEVHIDLRTGLETDAGFGGKGNEGGAGGEGGEVPFVRRYQVSQDPDAASNRNDSGPIDMDAADATIAGQLSPDGTPSPIYDSDLVYDISREDFANTDVHVFGPTGDLITSRIGLRQNETPGLVCDPPFQPIVTLGDAGHPGAATANPVTCVASELNPVAAAAIQDFIRNRYPGARYKVAFVNRSTGYMGTGFVRVGSPRALPLKAPSGGGSGGTSGSSSTSGTTSNEPPSTGGTLPTDNEVLAKRGPQDFLGAYEVEGPNGGPVLMSPPNLTITVSRTRQDVKTLVGDDTPVEQIVGFEGGGLVDDTQVVITTEWLDQDGSPLPPGLPGYTGRLTRVVDEEGTLGPTSVEREDADEAEQAVNTVGHFSIRPGRQITVVKLPDNVPSHYYIHVSGANAERCGGEEQQLANPDSPDGFRWFQSHSPACTSFAQAIDEEFDKQKDRRPDRYVPVLVPIFDASGTKDAANLRIGIMRQAAQAKLDAGQKLTAQDLLLPKTEPIYTPVYRSEAQFTLYDLKEFESPELVTRFDKSAGRGKTTLSFGYDLGGSEFDPLTPFGSAKDPIWGLGFEELVAMVNDHDAKAEFDDIERFMLLSPAQQLKEVSDVAASLTPEDYLALQLYLANNRGNALYADTDVAAPLIDIDVSPITLYTRENITRFPTTVTPPPPVLEGYQAMPFTVAREKAWVTIKVTPRGKKHDDAKAIELVKRHSAPQGLNYFMLNGSELAEHEDLPAKLTLHVMAEADQGDDEKKPGPFATQRAEINVTRELIRDRALGEIIEHDVNVLDGSLRLARTDFALKGLGPELSLIRSYTNLGSQDGLLGPGWTQSFDLSLWPTALGLSGAGKVPEWVDNLRSATMPCPNHHCLVEEKLFPEGGVQLYGVSVNGSSFRYDGTEWVAERGRHVRLVQECEPADDKEKRTGCFKFTAKDGTRYTYDYPKTTAGTDAELGSDATMLSKQDHLLERLYLADLRINAPEVTAPKPIQWMKPLPVRKVQDRFGNVLTFQRDEETDQLISVKDEVSGGSCSLVYAPDSTAGCDSQPPSDKKRLFGVKCLEGDLSIVVNYCYDENGYLQAAINGDRREEYGYEIEPKPDDDDAEADEEEDKDKDTYNLVEARTLNPGHDDQVMAYHYKEGAEKFDAKVLPEKIYAFDMMDHIVYPPTVVAPSSGDEDQARIEFGYNGFERTVSDARGPVHPGRVYTLNAIGNPTRIQEGPKTTDLQWSFDAGSSACGPTFAEDNQIVSRDVLRDDKGTHVLTTYAYDEDGNVTHECVKAGSGPELKSEQSWNLGELEYRKDFRGVEETWTYQTLTVPEGGDPETPPRFLSQYTNGGGIVTTFTPSASAKGRPQNESTQGANQDSRTLTYTYDGMGNITSVTVSGSPAQPQRYFYDARGRLERELDELGRETKYEYDGNDNLRFTYLPALSPDAGQNLNATLETRYDAVGNKTYETDRNGLVIEYEHSARNQITGVKRTASDAEHPIHERSMYYDALGNLREETDWKGNRSKYTYDNFGSRLNTTDRNEKVTVTQHDYVGNLVKITDGEQLVTEIEYDALNRETKRSPKCQTPSTECAEQNTYYLSEPTLEVEGLAIAYQVDVEMGGHRTKTAFDGRDLMVVKQDPLENTFIRRYDALGRIYETKDEAGVVTKRKYDARGFMERLETLGNDGGAQGLLTTFEYDDVGNTTAEIVHNSANNPEGESQLRTGKTYDAWDRAITQTDPGSFTEHFSYDGEGEQVQHTDAAGRVRTWKRNQRSELVEYTDAETAQRTEGQPAQATTTTIKYDEIDANGNPELIVDANGVVAKLEYWGEEQIKKITQAYGTGDARSQEVTEIDGVGNPKKMTDFRGNTRTFGYSSMHRLASVKDALGREISYTYDAQGQIESMKNARGFVRYFVNDALGRPTDTFYPCSAAPCSAPLEQHTDYDGVGNVTLTRNRRGSETHYEHDRYLRLEAVQKSPQQGVKTLVITNEYDDFGNVVATVDAKDNRTEYRFNARNLLAKTIFPDAGEGASEEGRTETREYYPSGALLAVASPTEGTEQPQVVSFNYDREDRVIATSMDSVRHEGASVGGEVTTYRYDLLGNRTRITRPENQPGGKFANTYQELEYDDLNRVSVVTDEVKLSTRYTYDASDNLTDVDGPYPAGTEPDGSTPRTHFVIDPIADRAQEEQQHTRVGGPLTTRYTSYDEHDNVKTLVDANGRSFTYDYDAFERRVLASYPSLATAYYEPKSTNWDFDDDDNTLTIRQQKNGPEGVVVEETVETFDKVFDRLMSRRQRNRTVSYGYDDNGNRELVSTPAGDTTYTFDARNRIKTVEGAPGTTRYDYYTDGRLKGVARGNGTSTAVDYAYPSRRLKQLNHQFAGGESAVLAYVYDKNGNPQSKGDTRSGAPDVTSFDEYDAANRLVQLSRGLDTTRYDYKKSYNRETETAKHNNVIVSQKAFSYDKNDRLDSVTEGVGAGAVTSYGYDNNGNLKSRVVSTAPAARNDFEYDSRDQLVRVTRGPPATAQVLGRYDYDADGMRIRSVDDDRGTVDYLYDDDNVVEERIEPAVGAPRTARYQYGNDLLAIEEPSGTKHFHQDALGTTVALTDDAGVESVSYKHDVWGNRASVDGDETDNRHTFTQQEYDEATGLYYYGARFYDPTIGRFLTEDTYAGDPNEPSTQNGYLYANSNPGVFVDPDGHAPVVTPGEHVARALQHERYELMEDAETQFAKMRAGCPKSGCSTGRNLLAAPLSIGYTLQTLGLKMVEGAIGAVDTLVVGGVGAYGLIDRSPGTDEASRMFVEKVSAATDTKTWIRAGADAAMSLRGLSSGDPMAVMHLTELVGGAATMVGGAARGIASLPRMAMRAEGMAIRAARYVQASVTRITVELKAARIAAGQAWAITKSSVSKFTQKAAQLMTSAAKRVREVSRSGTVAGRRAFSAIGGAHFSHALKMGIAEVASGVNSFAGSIQAFPRGFAKGLKQSRQAKAFEFIGPIERNAARRGPTRTLNQTSDDLLPGELEIGSYGDIARSGDDLTPHHMPSSKYMEEKFGIAHHDSLAMNIEQKPGAGGRHRATSSYGKKPFLQESPRSTLARDIADLRDVYKQNGLYGPDVRKALQEYISKSKSTYPKIFGKE